MISTTWTDAPAGFSGPGLVGMSPYAWSSVVGGAPVLMAPTAAPIRGTTPGVACRRGERGDMTRVRVCVPQVVSAVGSCPLRSGTEHVVHPVVL